VVSCADILAVAAR
nr:RecName: Full=Peroxidase 2 [Betula pendula]